MSLIPATMLALSASKTSSTSLDPTGFKQNMDWSLCDLALAVGLFVVTVTLVMAVTGYLTFRSGENDPCASSSYKRAYLFASFGAFWSVVSSLVAMLGVSVYSRVANRRK
jgi:hypothetical protein